MTIISYSVLMHTGSGFCTHDTEGGVLSMSIANPKIGAYFIASMTGQETIKVNSDLFSHSNKIPV